MCRYVIGCRSCVLYIYNFVCFSKPTKGQYVFRIISTRKPGKCALTVDLSTAPLQGIWWIITNGKTPNTSKNPRTRLLQWRTVGTMEENLKLTLGILGVNINTDPKFGWFNMNAGKRVRFSTNNLTCKLQLSQEISRNFLVCNHLNMNTYK